ncbi:hypothetical protein LMG7974_00951 [Campylobacter majalis]|uniref:TonB-dependent receptor plug domain-containing protein n=1 Tax=Campylobacter majalis TaxID=2790656 RepID=A0ABN7K743_9BACT|nr:TonB-dependent receptor plug domain-containing protein [Campylobacter majalis]CAD7288328.1 hypothetical protein LMG7974_00951 [Campylobacter majalis]
MFGSYGGGSSLIAAEQSLELESIEVIGSSEQDVKELKISEIKKTSKELDKQQVSDSRDLVKYETGISVVETGRMGASGYSIRGVDENRVDISIDGLKQAETISSQGFKDLFEGYGNFNNTRNSVEMETVKQVNITKGADSIKAGSGALGGSVMFETKDARDYLLEKDWHYGFKVGHSSANSERMHSHTLAARAKWFDVLVIKTDRDGHETKNYGYSSYDDDVTGKLRERVDPYHIKKESTLLKFGFQFNETNRFNIAYDNSKNRNQGTDWSNILTQISRGSGGQSNSYISDKIRHTDDSVERKNLNFSYENYDETPFWDSLKISYSKQKINLRAKTDEYCDGKKCIDIQNPSGIQLKNGKIVDQYGGEFNHTSEKYKTIQDTTVWNGAAYTEEEFKKDLADAKSSGVKLAPNFEEDLKSYIGKSYSYYGHMSYIKPKVTDTTVYTITDSKGKALAEGMAGDYKTLTSRDLKVDCNKYPNLCTSGIAAFSTSTRSYKKYDLKPNANGIASLDNNTDSILLPPSLGYLQNLWKDRSLKNRHQAV